MSLSNGYELPSFGDVFPSHGIYFTLIHLTCCHYPGPYPVIHCNRIIVILSGSQQQSSVRGKFKLNYRSSVKIIYMTQYLSSFRFPNKNINHFLLPFGRHLPCCDNISLRMNRHRNHVLFVFLEEHLVLRILWLHYDPQSGTCKNYLPVAQIFTHISALIFRVKTSETVHVSELKISIRHLIVQRRRFIFRWREVTWILKLKLPICVKNYLFYYASSGYCCSAFSSSSSLAFA